MKYKLGDLIRQRREKNSGENLPIVGVSKEGFIPPKQEDADISIYNVFYKNDFVYNPARMELGSIAYNNLYDKAICSSLYEMFYIIKESILLPEYLALIIKTKWFSDYCNFMSNGSAREYCRFNNISQIIIDIPSIEDQKKIIIKIKNIEENLKIKQEKINIMEQLAEIQYKEMIKNNKEWNEVQLGSLAEISAGGDNPGNVVEKKDNEYFIPVYSNGTKNDGLFGYTNISKISKNSITISARGAIGYTVLHREPYFPIVRLISIVPYDTKYIEYLYFYFKNNKFDENGTSQQQVTIPYFSNMKIKIPDEKEIEVFNSMVTELMKNVYYNKKIIEQLELLRECIISKIK